MEVEVEMGGGRGIPVQEPTPMLVNSGQELF